MMHGQKNVKKLKIVNFEEHKTAAVFDPVVLFVL